MNPVENFRAAMRAAGLDYAGLIHADGKLHRFKAAGDHEKNSWYVLHAWPAGCRCFRMLEAWHQRNMVRETPREFYGR